MPKLGEDEAILTNIFQRGLNQVDKLGEFVLTVGRGFDFPPFFEMSTQPSHLYIFGMFGLLFFQKFKQLMKDYCKAMKGRTWLSYLMSHLLGVFNISDGLNSSINEWAEDLLVNFGWILELSQDERGA